jgi:hypothetical protein
MGALFKPEKCDLRIPGRDRTTNSIARWKIGNIGNIIVNQQLNRQQTGNRPATFSPFWPPAQQSIRLSHYS